MPHLFHNVNNLGLKPRDLTGDEPALAETSGEGGTAGFELLAAEVLQRLAGDCRGVGRRAVEEKGGQDGLRFGRLRGQKGLR
jgi:hypothetical protein